MAQVSIAFPNARPLDSQNLLYKMLFKYPYAQYICMYFAFFSVKRVTTHSSNNCVLVDQGPGWMLINGLKWQRTASTFQKMT